MFKKNWLSIWALATILSFTTACTSPVSNDEEKDPVSESDELHVPETSLQKGDQNQSVQLLQKILMEIDYPIQETGKFDADTTWAITDFQLQQDNLHATGIYDNDTRHVIEKAFKEEINIDPGAGLEQPDEDADENIVANPYEILSLVNKQYALPTDYIPNDLVIPNVRFPFTEDLPKKQMREVAADALEEMFEAGDKAGLDLFAQSGYRSFERQEALFASYSEENGEKAANKYSARPGESEHQTGLTMDITSPEIDHDLNVEFGETDEGKWVKKHAADFGYIIRYPKGKEDITGYQFEPWHLRYVGKKAAKEITDQDLTLEEYIDNITVE